MSAYTITQALIIGTATISALPTNPPAFVLYALKGDPGVAGANGTNGTDASVTASNIQAALGYVPESTSNKVTSLSVSSTDVEYPSAKLVYDQIQLLAPKDSPAFTTVANFLTGANQTRITSDPNGPVVAAASASSIYLTLQSFQGIGNYLKLNGYSGIDIFNNATHGARIVQNEFQFGNATKLGWSSSGIGFAADASIRWLSAGKLAQREGTTAQSYYLYNTWSNSADNEFGGLRWDTNRFELFTDKLGSGSYRDLWILGGNPAGHRLKVAGSTIQDFFGGVVDGRAGISLDYHANIFAVTGAATKISSANSSMTGQATLELTSNTSTVTTQIIRPNVKDGGGGYTGAGHHLKVTGGQGAAGNNNGGNLLFESGAKTGTGTAGNIEFWTNGAQRGYFDGSANFFGGATTWFMNNDTIVLGAATLQVANTQRIGFSTNTGGAGPNGAGWYSPSANAIEQRNGVNAQASRIYNTYSNATDWERVGMRWNANVFEIGTEAGGTGSVRNLVIRTTVATSMVFSGYNITVGANMTFGNNRTDGFQLATAAHTSDATESNSGRVCTNRGAAGTVTRTLQSYTDNMHFKRVANFAYRIKPPVGQSWFRQNGTIETAGKYLELASQGASFEVYTDGTYFYSFNETGTITVEP